MVSLLSEVGQKKWTMYKLELLTPELGSLAALSFLSPDGAVNVSATLVAWPRELPVTMVGLADSQRRVCPRGQRKKVPFPPPLGNQTHS